MKKIITILMLIMGIPFFVMGQDNIEILPAYTPSHLKLKISSGVKNLTYSKIITANDILLRIEAFNAEEFADNVEGILKVKKTKVDLVRNGRLIKSAVFENMLDLKPFLELSKDGDIYRINVSDVEIVHENNKLEPYIYGEINFLLTYQSYELKPAE